MWRPVTMSEDEVFRANRPAFAVAIRNCLNRYVLDHSQSLAAHQVRRDPCQNDRYWLWCSGDSTSPLAGLVLQVLVCVGYTYLLYVIPASCVPNWRRFCWPNVRNSNMLTFSLILTSALAVYITAFVKVRIVVERFLSPLRTFSAYLVQPLRLFADYWSGHTISNMGSLRRTLLTAWGWRSFSTT